MVLNLFHGSDHIVGQPVYGMGKMHNDYGKGFYCTEDEDIAKEWSAFEGVDGYINHYELDIDKLEVLDLNCSQYTVLHWITVLIENRIFDLTTPLAREAKRFLIENYHLCFDDIDIVAGYRADDSYFSYARDFVNGVISYEQLTKALRLGKLGNQICLISRMAFERIKFIDAVKVDSSLYYPRKCLREQNAKAGYKSMEKAEYHRGELYITRILDEEIMSDDIRIR